MSYRCRRCVDAQVTCLRAFRPMDFHQQASHLRGFHLRDFHLPCQPCHPCHPCHVVPCLVDLVEFDATQRGFWRGALRGVENKSHLVDASDHFSKSGELRSWEVEAVPTLKWQREHGWGFPPGFPSPPRVLNVKRERKKFWWIWGRPWEVSSWGFWSLC